MGFCVLVSFLFRELGFTPVEVNASDTRNKADNSILKGIGAKLANSIKELSTNSSIGLGADHKPKKVIACASCVFVGTSSSCRC